MGGGASITDGDTEEFSVTYNYGSDNNISQASVTFGEFYNRRHEFTEEFTYQNGYMISDVLNDTLVWELFDQDRWGNVTENRDYQGGTQYTYNDYGNMLYMNRHDNYMVSETYAYDIQTGNMISKNGIPLTYDSMNQLTGYGDCTYSYDTKGNITNQPHVGEFSYNGFKIDDMNIQGHLTLDGDLRISYYKAIERPKSIENDRFKAEFYYDGNGDRIMMKVYEKISGTPTLSFTRYYFAPNAEMTADSHGHYRYLYYAGNDAYTAPAVMVTDENRCSSIYQITRDNIGSVLVYANANGDHYENSYTPWGIRSCGAGNYTCFYNPGQEPGYGPFFRTYTGHEDLWMFGLINANARLYSPYLGRFVSPDPLLNSEGGPLDYNPYIYARNNPYKYIDKNGEFPWLLFGAALGAGFNIWQNSDNIHCFGDALFYGFAGAGAGSLGGWIGPSAAVSLGLGATGAIAGSVAGAITGYISSTIGGTLNAAYSGDFSKFSLGSIFTQTAFSAAIGGIMGGIDAVSKNTNFFTGGIKEELFGACYCSTCNSSGFSLGESTITGTYVGTVDGVPVFETKKFGSVIKKQADGYYHFRGITIPKRGIIVAQGAYSSGKDIGTALVQHEFGHILQCRMYGSYAYYHIIAPESMANCIYSNAMGNQAIHDNFWTETWANYLSKEFFGSKYVGGPDYPAINISSWNRFRMEVARTCGVISGWRGLLQW
jgi:RHS repeat-associated protein